MSSPVFHIFALKISKWMETYADSGVRSPSDGAKEEQVWLQVWLPFIKQLPMQYFSRVITYLNISMPLWCESENSPNETCRGSLHTKWPTVVCMNADRFFFFFFFNNWPNYRCLLQIFRMVSPSVGNVLQITLFVWGSVMPLSFITYWCRKSIFQQFNVQI